MHLQVYAGRANGAKPLALLREARRPPSTYQPEGSNRVSRGSVTLPSGGRWSSELEVPTVGDQSALLTIRRDGPGTLAPDEASLVIPSGESDALLALLTGLLAQAKAEGVLPVP